MNQSNKSKAWAGFREAVKMSTVLVVMVVASIMYFAGISLLVDKLVWGRGIVEFAVVMLKIAAALGGIGYLSYIGYFLSDGHDIEEWTGFWFVAFMVLIGIVASVLLVLSRPIAV